MRSPIRPLCLALCMGLSMNWSARAKDPVLPGVGAALEEMVARKEVAGAVTVVVSKDRVLGVECAGLADLASQRPMTPDAMFWIASMTKPLTAAALLMLQDEGRLRVTDPVAKYLPEFEGLKTPSGRPANLTIQQVMTHTSGLGEADAAGAKAARTLADLVPLWLAAPMQYEPGEKWEYTQSGINVGARIVEVVSGQSFDGFLKTRLFEPLGMKDTTFYPEPDQRSRLATAYTKNAETGVLEPVPPLAGFGSPDRPPQGHAGLYSTAGDYARFCQMLLGGGQREGRVYLSPEAVRLMKTPLTGELPTGFLQGEKQGSRGANYGWGIGACVLRSPHAGVAAMLSAGTFGHGGLWGTQAWVDPVRGVAYVLMVQRANTNGDASEVRRVFQQAASDALGPGVK